MAQIKIASTEVPDVVRLLEQLFPGVKLDALNAAISGLTIKSDTTLTKMVGQNQSVVLEVVVDPS